MGIKQRIEILKALYLGADILIMDEPTAVLTPQEIEGLFQTMRELRDSGASIILITQQSCQKLWRLQMRLLFYEMGR